MPNIWEQFFQKKWFKVKFKLDDVSKPFIFAYIIYNKSRWVLSSGL